MANFRKFTTTNGWSDDRLMEAYDLIDAVKRECQDLRLDRDFTQMLAEIERVDAEIIEARGEQADERSAVLRQQASEIVRAEQGMG